LYAPPIADAIDGYRSVNVAAQLSDQQSLLNWMKHLIRVRHRYKVFGRGTMQFLQPDNQSVLAYLRKHEGTCLLVVSNLSGSGQSAALDLFGLEGRTPVDLVGSQPFPTIGKAPYVVTLEPHSFYWLLLTAND
jgi:maltose alpha-D-glucosyltransferase/alpha-amylase